MREGCKKEQLSWIFYVTLQCIATQSFLSWGRHCSILFRLCLPSHTSLELIWYFLNRPMGSDGSRLTRNTGYCGWEPIPMFKLGFQRKLDCFSFSSWHYQIQWNISKSTNLAPSQWYLSGWNKYFVIMLS